MCPERIALALGLQQWFQQSMLLLQENECPKQWRVQVLKTMRTIVRRMTETVRGNSMEARFHARVPVLCFQHKPSGMRVH